MAVDDASYNSEVKGWGGGTLKKIKDAASSYDIKHRADSQSPNSSIKALNVRYALKEGRVRAIAYKIRRHLVFVHKGVGKETPISKAGSTNRKAKPFFNEPIDENIDQLADIVAEHTGDMISNNILIQ